MPFMTLLLVVTKLPLTVSPYLQPLADRLSILLSALAQDPIYRIRATSYNYKKSILQWKNRCKQTLSLFLP